MDREVLYLMEHKRASNSLDKLVAIYYIASAAKTRVNRNIQQHDL